HRHSFPTRRSSDLLELGLSLRGSGLPWVVDLGDPVLAAYTPRRWRARSLRLERAVFRHARHVIVTNTRALEEMRSRHGDDTPMSVITQGFDLTPAPQDGSVGAGVFEAERLELLYTGSLCLPPHRCPARRASRPSPHPPEHRRSDRAGSDPRRRTGGSAAAAVAWFPAPPPRARAAAHGGRAGQHRQRR